MTQLTPCDNQFYISGTERADIPARRMERLVDEALKAFRV